MVKGKIMDKFAKDGTPLKVVYDPTAERKRTKQEANPTETKAAELITSSAKPELEQVTTSGEKEKTEKPKTAEPEKLLEERVYAQMKLLAANGIKECTSTLLRDKLALDKESGRDQIRRIAKRLQTEGKVTISEKKVGERKQYVYALK